MLSFSCATYDYGRKTLHDTAQLEIIAIRRTAYEVVTDQLDGAQHRHAHYQINKKVCSKLASPLLTIGVIQYTIEIFYKAKSFDGKEA
ncbi:hypothetical protein TELCIR_14637 [Teladorsagia circumcincta]|uniref:Uncharacterized protein n=1 Tax=Teladorsagia circumcincta TaxID=45464 RepID=A0A2G9U0J6_TELCI|nr:hypothetical protein TELCIR_14637 [Teladorsagia circumcincta]